MRELEKEDGEEIETERKSIKVFTPDEKSKLQSVYNNHLFFSLMY